MSKNFQENSVLSHKNEETVKQNYTIKPDRYSAYNVKRGLRNADGTGVLVGLTSIGEVRGYIIDDNERVPIDGRLFYRGIDVKDLVSASEQENRFGFEETCYLLLFGSLPSQSELEDFRSLITQNQELPDNFVEDMILKAPSNNIMNKLARGVLALYSYDDNPDDLDFTNIMNQSIALLARFPSLIAYAYQAKQHYYDGKSLVIHTPKQNASIAENLLHLTRLDNKYTEEEARALDIALTLHAEHGGGNNSAFATHVVSSSGTDTYSVIATAVGALKGFKHGGANIKARNMMIDLESKVSNWEDEDELFQYLTKVLYKEEFDKTGLIYGFGHAVYTISDPRATMLKAQVEKLALGTEYEEEYHLYERVEKLVPAVLRQKYDRHAVTNIDFYSGLLYKMLNIPEELFTPIFAMARIVGWCAHRIEEVYANGKIIRPAYKSVATRQKYVPIQDR